MSDPYAVDPGTVFGPAEPAPLRDLPPIRARIVCIGGWLQRRHGRTGIERVWQRLRLEHEQPANGCRVSIHPWCDDWREFVGHVLRTGPADPAALDVRIVGYSWGVGHGAVALARLLRAEGARVRNLVSCDGVWHSRWMPWRALGSPLISRVIGAPRIVIPSNVLRVDLLRQQVSLPAGHEIVAETWGQAVIDHGFVAETHGTIDDSDAFLRIALEACR